MPKGAILLAICLPVLAQFRDLATTRDGGALYFASELRQKGTGQEAHSKLFRVTGEKLELFQQQHCLALPGNIFGGTLLPCQLRLPEVSGDGRLIAATAFGSRPRVGPTEEMRLYGATIPPGISTAGSPRISRDGRWLLRLSELNAPGPPELIELATGRATVIEGGRPWNTSRHALADGGVVLLATETGFGLWRNGSVSRIFNSRCISSAWLSPDASRFYYEWTDTGRYKISMRQLATGVEADLLTGPIAPVQTRHRSCEFPHFQLSLSDDGTRALAIGESTNLLGPEGSVAPAPAFATSGVLSGDGRLAFLATAENRLIRMDTASGAVTELIPASPIVTSGDGSPWGSNSFCPGCYLRLSGTGLGPLTQRTQRLLIEGRPAHVISGNQLVVGVRIPWETTVGEPVSVEVEGAPQFESGTRITLTRSAPLAWLPIAIRGDFSGPILPGLPARPGEAVTLYLTGLGRVRPPIPDDQAAPLESLVFVEQPIQCAAESGTEKTPATVEFAGLAPGQFFIYQVNVRVPQSLAGGTYSMRCAGVEVPLPVRLPSQ